MKKFIKMISIVLVMCTIIGNIITVSAYSNDQQSSVKCVINEKLIKYLSALSDDDIVNVVLWLREPKNDIELDTADIDLGNYSKCELLLKQQEVVSEKRKLDKENTLNNNKTILEKLFNEYGYIFNVNYISKFTPYIDVNISKKNIFKLQESTLIEEIYLESLNDIQEQEIHINSETRSIDNSTYGYWQEAATIQVMRDVYGYNGQGINIGLVQNGLPDTSDSSFDYAVSNNKITKIGTAAIDNHATYMASIIVGKTSDYYGAAFKSHLFCSGPVNNNYVDAIENLVDNYNINILDASIYCGNNNSLTYDATSRFFDSLAYEDDLIVCFSSGNDSGSGTYVCSGAMAYNVITVGNINDDNSISITDDFLTNDSMYSSSNYLSYKPDICAPGARVATPLATDVLYYQHGGTSASAAVLSGCCALLLQSCPSLLTKPTLLKSILLSSARHLTGQQTIYSTSTSIDMAIDRPYGAGCVDTAAAYSLYNDNQYLHVPIDTVQTNPYILSFVANTKSLRKKLYICLTWEQKASMNDNTSYLPYYHDLSLYDSNGNRLAYSSYFYDRKQYICFHLTQTGTYQIRVSKYGTSNYSAAACVSYAFL